MSSVVSGVEEKLAGGVAVVTGAGAGIGAGLARRAGAVGMTVVVTDLSAERANTVAGEIEAAGGQAVAMTLDVSRPEAMDRLAAEVFDRFGAVRLLVNNAGIETMGFTWEIPAERWQATLDINIGGVVHGVRAFVPRMLAAGQEAWIANLASVGAFGQMPTQTAYIMTKHAVQAFSECLYLEMELAKAPIHVSSVVPGMVRTRIFDEDAGAGEPAGAAPHRRVMRELMAAHGMDLEEAARTILAQIAEGRFWVSTQPGMTQAALDTRAAFLRHQQNPSLTEQAQQLLKGERP